MHEVLAVARAQVAHLAIDRLQLHMARPGGGEPAAIGAQGHRADRAGVRLPWRWRAGARHRIEPLQQGAVRIRRPGRLERVHGQQQAAHRVALEGLGGLRGELARDGHAALFVRDAPLPAGGGREHAEHGHRAEQRRDHAAPPAIARGLVGLVLRDARIDERERFGAQVGALARALLRRALAAPALRLGEQWAAQHQRRIAMVRLPCGAGAVQPLAPQHELAVGGQPAGEPLPAAEQGFVRDFEHALGVWFEQLPATCACSRCEQPRRHEAFELRMRGFGQLAPRPHAAHEAAFGIDAHEAEQGAAQRVQPVRAAAFAQGLGRARHGPLQAAELVAVLVDGQARAALQFGREAVVQFAQREGQQGQRVVGGGVGHHGLCEAGFELDAGHARRPFDDLADLGQRDLRQVNGLVGHAAQQRVGLERTEKVRAQRGQHEQRAVALLGHAAQQAQKGGLLGSLGRLCARIERLFELVDDEHHARLRPGLRAQVVDESVPIGGAACLGWVACMARVIECRSEGAPARRARQSRERHRHAFQRLGEWPERRRNQPRLRVARQARHDAGPHQRRLAAARGAEHQQQPGPAQAAQPGQRFQSGLDRGVAAEVHRRVSGFERGQAGVGWARAVPIGQCGRVQSGGFQAAQQALPAGCAVGVAVGGRVGARVATQVGHLQVGEQGPDRRGVEPHREDRLAQRPCMRDLGEAPGRGHRVCAAQHHHRLATAQLRVQLALPVAPGGDAGLRVEVEKDRAVPGADEHRVQLAGNRVVGAAVADEDGAHGPGQFRRAMARAPPLNRRRMG